MALCQCCHSPCCKISKDCKKDFKIITSSQGWSKQINKIQLHSVDWGVLSSKEFNQPQHRKQVCSPDFKNNIIYFNCSSILQFSFISCWKACWKFICVALLRKKFFLIIIIIIIIILRARNMPTKCDVTFPLETRLNQSRKSWSRQRRWVNTAPVRRSKTNTSGYLLKSYVLQHVRFHKPRVIIEQAEASSCQNKPVLVLSRLSEPSTSFPCVCSLGKL